MVPAQWHKQNRRSVQGMAIENLRIVARSLKLHNIHAGEELDNARNNRCEKVLVLSDRKIANSKVAQPVKVKIWRGFKGERENISGSHFTS